MRVRIEMPNMPSTKMLKESTNRDNMQQRGKSVLLMSDELVEYQQYLVDIQTEVLKVERLQKKEVKAVERLPPCPHAWMKLSPSIEAENRCPFGCPDKCNHCSREGCAQNSPTPRAIHSWQSSRTWMCFLKWAESSKWDCFKHHTKPKRAAQQSLAMLPSFKDLTVDES